MGAAPVDRAIVAIARRENKRVAGRWRCKGGEVGGDRRAGGFVERHAPGANRLCPYAMATFERAAGDRDFLGYVLPIGRELVKAQGEQFGDAETCRYRQQEEKAVAVAVLGF